MCVCPELISRMVDKDYFSNPQHFYFVYFIIEAYRDALTVGTERQALWELQVESVKRAKQPWQPTRESLLCHIDQLKKLKLQMKIIAFIQRENEINSICQSLGFEDYRAPPKLRASTKKQIVEIVDDNSIPIY